MTVENAGPCTIQPLRVVGEEAGKAFNEWMNTHGACAGGEPVCHVRTGWRQTRANKARALAFESPEHRAQVPERWLTGVVEWDARCRSFQQGKRLGRSGVLRAHTHRG